MNNLWIFQEMKFKLGQIKVVCSSVNVNFYGNSITFKVVRSRTFKMGLHSKNCSIYFGYLIDCSCLSF